MDLRAIDVDTARHQVTLQWTAQGAQMDVGSGRSIVIYYGMGR